MVNNEVKRFGKCDWYEFAGAEKFKNGAEPFIYRQELNDGAVTLTMVGDANGIEIILESENDEFDGVVAWQYLERMSALKVEGAMRAIAKRLQEYEYAPDLAWAIDHNYDKNNEFYDFEYIGD